MTRLYGWAKRGSRLVDKVPHGHWKTSTFIAALRCDRVEAPCLFDGPINGERFLAYVREFLIPTLKPNDIVVADNLGSHKGKAVRNAIRTAGARLVFLPKYSPDLNPIEQVFAKVKTLVRKAEPRTFDATSDALKNALARIPPNECAYPLYSTYTVFVGSSAAWFEISKGIANPPLLGPALAVAGSF